MSGLGDYSTRELLAEVDRRQEEAIRGAEPPQVLFFGVHPPSHAGHYLRSADGRDAESKFSFKERDGYLYPWKVPDYTRRPQDEGKFWLWRHPIKPITALLSWDRSADSRGNCCASFVVLADVTPQEAERLARASFPEVFHRIEKHLGRPTKLAGLAES